MHSMNSDSPALQFGPISNAAEGPLYEQIANAVAREIAAQRLAPGEMLPSVRKLAADLLVSVITIKRAYEELERAGLIYSRQGVGAFVAEGADAGSANDALAEVKAGLAAAISAARRARLPEPQMFQLLRTMLKEGDRP